MTNVIFSEIQKKKKKKKKEPMSSFGIEEHALPIWSEYC